MRNLTKAHSDNLERWIKRNFNSTIEWFYPDKNKLLDNKNNLLIFLNRENLDDIGSKNEKVYSIIKYILVRKQETCGNPNQNRFLRFYIKHLEENFVYNVCQKESFFIQSNSNHIIKDWNRINVFLEQTHINLVDFNLYSNYAKNILGEKINIQNNSLPSIALIDKKNQTIFRMDEEFNFNNLIRFLRNITFQKQKQVFRTKQVNTNNKFLNVTEINSKQLEDILSNIDKYRDKDIVLVYFNNWCGFCKLVNYNLMLTVYKYFKNIQSLIILKIDVDSNDFETYLQVNHLPTLMYLPASITNSRESTVFDYKEEYSVENILKFILYETENPDLISNFILNNFLKREKDNNLDFKLRSNFIDVLTKKFNILKKNLNH